MIVGFVGIVLMVTVTYPRYPGSLNTVVALSGVILFFAPSCHAVAAGVFFVSEGNFINCLKKPKIKSLQISIVNIIIEIFNSTYDHLNRYLVYQHPLSIVRYMYDHIPQLKNG